ncbi:hypothetical protein [Alkalihalobacillus sp. 1P02AB]
MRKRSCRRRKEADTAGNVKNESRTRRKEADATENVKKGKAHAT